MRALERNTFASVSGTVWSIVLGIACVPFLIRFLGAEAFGLTGVFLTLQSLFTIFDLGIGATLSREIARLDAGGASARQQRDLVFTLQAVYWSLALLLGIAVFAAAPFVAAHWVRPESLSEATVTTCVRLMGVTIGLQFPFIFYQCGMLGLQKHVTFNTLGAVVATARGPVSLLLLWLVSPSPQMYFGTQLAVSAAATGVAALLLWRCLPREAEGAGRGARGAGGPLPSTGFKLLPPAPRALRSRFRIAVIRDVWRFGAAYSANSLASLALLQGDKIILSTLLPLSTFGYYTLAQRLVSGLSALIAAIDGAIFPQLAGAVAGSDEAGVARVYHRACQLMAVVLAPLAVVMALFSREIVMLFTRDAAAVERTHVVLTLLAVGMLLHGLTHGPHYLQLAYGSWRLISISNAVLLLIVPPLCIVMATRFGAVGGAAVWILLNVGYLATIPLMHRRLLRGEQWRWLARAVALPLAGALIPAGIAFWLRPVAAGSLATFLYVTLTALAAMATAAALTPETRYFLQTYLRRSASAA